MANEPPLLEFRNISCEAGGRRILRAISIKVERGDTLVLLGRSGSGKTTLLRTALGLVRPVEGEVRFDGRALADWDLIRMRRRVGYVIQDVGLFPHRTVAENVALVPRLEGWSRQAAQARVEMLLQQVNLPAAEFGGRRPRELSGGQKQRVGIARALAADPPLLLLDEPFGALDPVTRFDLQREFLRLRHSFAKTAVFVTHDVREALLVGTRIALLREGELEFLGTPEEFLNAGSAEAHAFLECLGSN